MNDTGGKTPISLVLSPQIGVSLPRAPAKHTRGILRNQTEGFVGEGIDLLVVELQDIVRARGAEAVSQRQVRGVEAGAAIGQDSRPKA